jgi:hypothetical protein
VREVKRGGPIQICFRCPIGKFLFIGPFLTNLISRFLRIHTITPLSASPWKEYLDNGTPNKDPFPLERHIPAEARLDRTPGKRIAYTDCTTGVAVQLRLELFSIESDRTLQ